MLYYTNVHRMDQLLRPLSMRAGSWCSHTAGFLMNMRECLDGNGISDFIL